MMMMVAMMMMVIMMMMMMCDVRRVRLLGSYEFAWFTEISRSVSFVESRRKFKMSEVARFSYVQRLSYHVDVADHAHFWQQLHEQACHAFQAGKG
jgi:hypothetical protein